MSWIRKDLKDHGVPNSSAIDGDTYHRIRFLGAPPNLASSQGLGIHSFSVQLESVSHNRHSNFLPNI